MNKFESIFFAKYIPEGHEIKGVVHIHLIDILTKLFLWISMGAFLPSFLYYFSERIRDFIPFYFLEGLLIVVFLKIIYDIFDWYNDVWILTNIGIIQLVRSGFKTKTISVEYEKVEGLEVEQNGFVDKMLKKGNLVVHKIGDDSFVLMNVFNPYKAVNLIEELTEEADFEEEKSDDKFDIIMDALGGVVENYLEKKVSKTEKEEEIKKVIELVENSHETIDLRNL